ncbi:hypothetical protein DVH24_010425 [Malus domestica]|uniref:HAT C-terminal dimerisation domain-containing protein n=1 Tax=Malus domestica TaxID=3750 RepID=A0A498JRN1_MALDO|nr:hypothetical protein DVH24_010425 [Malus domestica]
MVYPKYENPNFIMVLEQVVPRVKAQVPHVLTCHPVVVHFHTYRGVLRVDDVWTICPASVTHHIVNWFYGSTFPSSPATLFFLSSSLAKELVKIGRCASYMIAYKLLTLISVLPAATASVDKAFSAIILRKYHCVQNGRSTIE